MWRYSDLKVIITLNIYNQVCGDGKALLDTLQTPVSSGSSNSLTAKADYSEAAGHVLDVVHEVWIVSIDLFSEGQRY